MIFHSGFRVEPWSLHETTLNLDVLSETESLFALSNGNLGVRGNLDEGEPHGFPGTYLNGYYELLPLPMGESQYGAPESSQTLIDVTNGKLIRLLVDDEPFDLRYGRLISHERRLDFRGGTLKRTVEWCSPAGRTVRVTSTRLVSFTHRAILAIAYEVEALDGRMNVVVQSELVANEAIPHAAGDPRSAAATESPLVSEEYTGRGTAALLHAQDAAERAAHGRRHGPQRNWQLQVADRDRGVAGPGARGRHRHARAWRASPPGEARRLWLVSRADAAGGARPGGGGDSGGEGGRLGAAGCGAASLSR